MLDAREHTIPLAITEGDGPDRVQQQFIILKYEVLPDNANQ
jgi:hypothetical protein